MRYACQLVADCLMAQGLDSHVALKAARTAIVVGVASDLIPAGHLERWERAAKVYWLRGQRLEVADLMFRFRLSRAEIYRLVSTHQARVRRVLKSSA